MTEIAAEAMWDDAASINITQLWLLKKHLCYQVGKMIFIAENEISADWNYYSWDSFKMANYNVSRAAYHGVDFHIVAAWE
jgi:hypothetical protein